MDMHRDSAFAGRLEVVSTGRRRRWSVEEKQRIVVESFSGHRQASATARRHDIPVSLLFKWRKDYREDGAPSPSRFVPAIVTPCAPGPATASPVSGGRMEIALSNGHRVVVAADVDASALGLVVDVLEGRR